VNPFRNRVCAWNTLMDSYATTHIDVGLEPLGYYATLLMRKTNPSRPHVDVTTAMIELREIPKLLFREAGTIARNLFGANLEIQFGILPMISDALALLTFMDAFEHRLKELRRLNSEKGLRRTINLDSSIGYEFVPSTSFNSVACYISGQLRKSTKVDISGHARWVSTLPRWSTDAERYEQCRKAIFGLTVDFATVWELIPWSWLIDWCSNAGDYILGQRNVVAAEMNTCVIMKHTITKTRSLNELVPDGYTFSSLHATCEEKSRVPIAPSLEASLPILSQKQVGILGSIGVGRRLSGF
jgi:hypothetical protein